MTATHPDFLPDHVPVRGTYVTTLDDMQAALVPGVAPEHRSQYLMLAYWRGIARTGPSDDVLELRWPLWFKGTLITGEAVVGDTTYIGPCVFHIPAIQHFRIVKPITFEGVLRLRVGVEKRS